MSEAPPPDGSSPPTGAAGESRRARELFEQRLSKAEALRARGLDPFPARTARTHTLAAARAAFEADEASPPVVTVAGRVQAVRDMGKLVFLDLVDDTDRLQVVLQGDPLAESDTLLEALDLGDFLEAAGPMTRTRRGEVSVQATGLQLLAKALRPPPEKFHGLHDQELRYRQRYLDLQANADAKEVFRQRSRIVAALRRFMDGRGFMEVETPVLQAEAGGAAARPFETHLNALDEPRVLRISLELHLKRLIVGGFDKVYEVGRIFRNEGVGNRWNPEFTMMESYEAYADYHDVARMVEEGVASIAEEVCGSLRLPWGDRELSLEPPFRRLTMVEAVGEYAGVDFRDYDHVEAMAELLREKNIPVPENAGWGKLFDELVSTLVEPNLIQPTFLMDYPVAISPLAKRTPDDPRLVERFEVFVGGWELGNAYSELNDPVDQRLRFEEQLALKAAGDDEVELLDEDFLVALEHGMPPTGGLGMGIDRLAMLLTNQQSIRDVILFPQLRQRSD